MNIEFTQRFKKEYYQLAENSNLAELLSTYIDIAGSAKNLSRLPNLKKLNGFKNYYRLKLGKAKIGLKIAENTLIFATFEQKNDISKKFITSPAF